MKWNYDGSAIKVICVVCAVFDTNIRPSRIYSVYKINGNFAKIDVTASFEEIGKNVITCFLCEIRPDNLVWGPFFEILTLMNTTMKKDFPKIYHFQKIPKIIRRRYRPPKLFSTSPIYHGAKSNNIKTGG